MGEEPDLMYELYNPAVGVDRRFYLTGGGVDHHHFAHKVQAGWPARCLEAGWWKNTERRTSYVNAVPIYLPDNDLVVPFADFIPFGVKWLGWSINTLFYAALSWMLFFGPASLRRVVRRRKGRCVRCGYDLRGSGGAKCPECGRIREGVRENVRG